jgi:phosphoglycolate phosphatase-like HAD superfamily hydrolase
MKNPVIFIDWDDTLFPTSYLRRVWMRKCQRAGGHWYEESLPVRMRSERAHIQRVGELAARVLKACSALGTVVIVTNSSRPWVDTSAELFYNTTVTVPVRYGLETLSSDELATLRLPAEEGKFRAFQQSSPESIICIGDSVEEIGAAQRFRASSSGAVKTVKLRKDPSAAGVAAQLTALLGALPCFTKPGHEDFKVIDEAGCVHLRKI